jgi:hypothetical protein
MYIVSVLIFAKNSLIILILFMLQKKKKKRSEDGEMIDGLNDESSQMSDVRVTVMETATGKSECMLS